MKSKAWTEKFMQGVFFVAACASVLAVALICIFLFANGIPAIKEIGFVKFITGEMWRPSNELFGIFPMIIGSLYVTAGAVIIGVPIGILTSVFMAMYCPKKIYRPLKAATELLAGIPSVVYGFFGLVVVVPIIRDFGRALKDAGLIKNAGDGNSILTTSLILAMMILPTIIGTTESAMRAVPAHYYEGALALGATKERSIFRVIIPAAKSGVIAGIVLGIGRAVGETMAVIMVAGNQPRLVGNLFKGIRTLTGNIVMEMGYATGLHREALIATGVVLFVFILIINFSVPLIMRTTEEALKSVPDSYREGSFGLGAGKLRTVFRIVLPSAVPGILAGVILAIGRIVGETAALIYTAGSVAQIPKSVMGSGRTLAVHMYHLSSEGLYMDQAYATAVILLVLVVGINTLSGMIARKLTKA